MIVGVQKRRQEGRKVVEESGCLLVLSGDKVIQSLVVVFLATGLVMSLRPMYLV